MEHVDVLIVGAGLSGVGAGCHLTRNLPETRFAILEGRSAMGGRRRGLCSTARSS